MDIGNIMGEVIANCKETNEKDGIRRCSRCGKPLESIKRNSRGEEIRIPIKCDCKPYDIPSQPISAEQKKELEEQRKKKEEQDERDRLIRLDQNRRKAFDDVRQTKWTFENDDKANAKITSVAQKYADNFRTMLNRGKGLLLYGGVGTGKSYIAACIVNELLKQEYPCRFTNFTRLANAFLGCDFGEKQEYLESLRRYKLLVIDDLGSERSTEFMNEVVYSVIDARQISQLPLIVTTNLTGDELKHPKDIESERVYSRLFEMCIPVEVKGQDRRKLKLRDSDKDLKEMLGLL